MKVVVSGYVGKKITGIGRNLISLLDNIDSNNQYIIYTNFDMVDEFKFKNSNVIVKPYNVSKNLSLKNLLWTTFVFPRKVKKEKADVALIPNFTFLLYKHRPTVLIMHDLIEFNVKNKFSKKKMFYRTKIADPISAKKCNKIITVSNNSKNDIMKFLKIKDEKIDVIYNGVDRTVFREFDNKNIFNGLLLSKGINCNFLLYVGTVDHPGKNSFGLIRAFERLKTEQKYSGKLVLAGMPGSGYEFIDEYIKKSEYKNDIIITGFVSDELLVALYNTCDVFCFLSLYEGFGIPPLEALACGAKVIVSNTSSLPEVVGDLGDIVDPTDIDIICSKIISSLGKEKNPIEKLEEHLQKFDWKNLAHSFENTLLQEIKQKK